MPDASAPVTPVPGSLKDAFAQLPPKPRPTPKPTPTKPAPQPDPSASAPVAAAPRPEPAPATTSRRPARRDTDPASRRADHQLLERRTVFVPDEVFDAVARRCEQTKLTRSQLVLLALNDTHARLGDLVAEDLRPTGITPSSGGLFTDLDLHVVRRAVGGRRQLTMLWTRSQLQVVDALVEQVRATDRSHMITVALRAWLRSGETS